MQIIIFIFNKLAESECFQYLQSIFQIHFLIIKKIMFFRCFKIRQIIQKYI
jgi:hypothetical protein